MKILILDIETSFRIAAVWGRYQQNVSMDQVLQDSYVLCWSAKWLGEKKVMADSLHYHMKEYKRDATSDKKILESVWKLLDQADYVIAHNGNRFDIPILNARFLIHGMKPPASYRVIDTLNVARQTFKFTSNRLDDLAKALKVGQKLPIGGFKLWKDVILKQDAKAFNRMVKYCKQDVVILEGVYNKLKAWDKKHPSTVVMQNLIVPKCNVCASLRIVKNGSYTTHTQTYQKYKCLECGHSLRSRKADKKSNSNLLRSV